MNIRHATMEDLDAMAAIEAAGYPCAEGASKASIRNRLLHFADCFWLLEDDAHQIVAFINGMCTDEPDLRDAMYDDPTLHDPNGCWLMIFSVVTDEAHRHQGCASQVMRRVIADTKAAGRTGLVLTCKERLLGFYAQFGFENEGVSSSTHGDVQWYQMRCRV